MKFLNSIEDASKVVQDPSNRFVTDAEKADFHSHSNAAVLADLSDSSGALNYKGAAIGGGGGSGDMLKSVYDTNNDGIVDNAHALNGYGTDNRVNSVLLSGRKVSTTIGVNSIAEGHNTTASGNYSHAEGNDTTASGVPSHAEGNTTIASGISSHAEGIQTIASGNYSHAEECLTTASGTCSHAEGAFTTASVYLSHVQGQYNKALTGIADTYSATADAFVIGNGTGSSALSNAFRVTFDGSTYGLSAFNSSGADYSEYFEWLDGNPNNEDRAGKFVTLNGEKIKLANDGDYIVGVVSATPAVIGDSASESWSGRYLTDVFGRVQYHEVDIPQKVETITHTDGTTEDVIICETHTETQPAPNPNYDPTKESAYINREKRPEWNTVGLVGKLIVADDGTCEVNGYCKPAGGIATKSEIGYRVMTRIDSSHIKVLIK